jgi:rare lipoprotein A
MQKLPSYCLFFYVVLKLSFLQAQAQTQIGLKDQGRASYYADKFHGRSTASGEKFNNKDFTAAHRTLPFNTMIKVTNKANGQVAIVRVNDRGPFSKTRILDVSRAAAEQLDMVRAGTAMVSIEVIGTDSMVATDPSYSPLSTEPIQARTISTASNINLKNLPALPKVKVKDEDKFMPGYIYSMWGTPKLVTGFSVQVGLFSGVDKAKELCKELISKKLEEVYIQAEEDKGEKLYRVMAGAFDNKKAASSYVLVVKENGFDGFVRKFLK